MLFSIVVTALLKNSVETIKNGLKKDGSLSLSTTSDEYRMLRSLLVEANSVTRAWMQEPEEEEAVRLQKLQAQAWQDCHNWLISELQKEHWSPEWLGWLMLSSLYTEAPWESSAVAFELLDDLLVHCSGKISEENLSLYSEALKRMGSIFLDESGQPPILQVLDSTLLVDGLSLLEAGKADTKQLAVDVALTISNLSCLRRLLVVAEKMPAYFQAYDQNAHVNKMTSRIQTGVGVLQNCLPEEERQDSSLPEHISDAAISEAVNLDGAQISDMTTSNQVPNRENARRQLQELIIFFRQTEPHSPVSWQLEKALDWLDLSFPDLLLKMTDGRQILCDEICRRVGLAELTGVSGKPQSGNREDTVYLSPSEAESLQSTHQEQKKTDTQLSGKVPEKNESTKAVLSQDLI